MARQMTTGNMLKLAAAVVGLVLILIIILQNLESTPTRILFATVTMPRALLLIITLLIGFGAGALTTWFYHTRKR